MGYLFAVFYAAICLGIGFLFYKLRVPKHVTRKIVHILVGFEWFILYRFFGGGIDFLIVCLLFLAILLLSYRKKLLPMIESEGDNSPGTVYYALAMSVMALITLFLPDMILPFGIGVLCTSLGDGFAGLLGRWINTPSNGKIYGNKTIYGSLFNFIICFISIGVFQREFNLGLTLIPILSIALFATELELFSTKGLDNISITLGSSFLTYFFLFFEGAENYVIPILLTPLIVVLSSKKRALTTDGIIAALVLDLLVAAAFHNEGFIILLIFFVGSIIVDKSKKRIKKSKQKDKTQPECRNCKQVLANGFVAAIAALLYLFIPSDLFKIAFVASVAEAFADTVASGIGILSGRSYDPFRRTPCTPGISGGMSWLGTLSSALAAILISVASYVLGFVDLIPALIIALSAFLGAAFDSLLGSLVQVKYRCPICGIIIESDDHCGSPTIRHSGLSFVNNNTVNLLGTVFSALLALFSFAIFFM